MSETTTTETDETQTGTTVPEFEPILSQDDFDKRTKARLARATAKFADYDQLRAASTELAQLKAANLTEGERQSERIRALETELQAERHSNLRRDVAYAKGVPAERISGSTREELEQSADELLAFVAERSQPVKPTRPAAGLKSGASNTDSRMDPKERAAAALRQWRSG
jgi:hypothetical protein